MDWDNANVSLDFDVADVLPSNEQIDDGSSEPKNVCQTCCDENVQLFTYGCCQWQFCETCHLNWTIKAQGTTCPGCRQEFTKLTPVLQHTPARAASAQSTRDLVSTVDRIRSSASATLLADWRPAYDRSPSYRAYNENGDIDDDDQTRYDDGDDHEDSTLNGDGNDGIDESDDFNDADDERPPCYYTMWSQSQQQLRSRDATIAQQQNEILELQRKLQHAESARRDACHEANELRAADNQFKRQNELLQKQVRALKQENVELAAKVKAQKRKIADYRLSAQPLRENKVADNVFKTKELSSIDAVNAARKRFKRVKRKKHLPHSSSNIL
eukprot:TRINITY_DN11349_c0_g2_i2.p2 TRINITY_DN11349_c0_g2~~TRINITY_DN11349_c0_g2_i2.p2  ORF type:complete len:328 (+),score=47.51 TRINITY_DN11349_c0_g2_i2:77-1060(+)